MNFRCVLLVVLMVVTNTVNASDLGEKVNQYFKAQIAVEHKDSTKADVQSLLSLLAEDATFEHPRYNAVQTKAEYKKGLLYYLGKYGKCDINISNTIVGLNAVTVEYTHPCIEQDGTMDTESNAQKLVTLFEFKDGKIALIRHYF